MTVGPCSVTARDTVLMSTWSSWGRPHVLAVVLELDLALVGVLVAVGITAHSLGVFAEGGDDLAMRPRRGLTSGYLVLQRPPTPVRPDGYPKATAWAGLVNGGWLLLLTALVTAAAVKRLVSGAGEVRGLLRAAGEQCRGAGHGRGCADLRADTDLDDDQGGETEHAGGAVSTRQQTPLPQSAALSGAIILTTAATTGSTPPLPWPCLDHRLPRHQAPAPGNRDPALVTGRSARRGPTKKAKPEPPIRQDLHPTQTSVWVGCTYIAEP